MKNAKRVYAFTKQDVAMLQRLRSERKINMILKPKLAVFPPSCG